MHNITIRIADVGYCEHEAVVNDKDYQGLLGEDCLGVPAMETAYEKIFSSYREYDHEIYDKDLKKVLVPFMDAKKKDELIALYKELHHQYCEEIESLMDDEEREEKYTNAELNLDEFMKLISQL